MSNLVSIDDLVVDANGIARCWWGSEPQIYRDYHDLEWGRELRGERELFELLTLEAFQSGLSWLTILKKRSGFKEAFADFDPDVVAEFGQADVDRLLGDERIIRNRLKVAAAINNAQAVVNLRSQGGLEGFLWNPAAAWNNLVIGSEIANSVRPNFKKQVPAVTDGSKELAKALKKAGFKFIGPTVAYAFMQSAGLVDDHLSGCHCANTSQRSPT